jgi:hypothetical protein
MAVRYTVSAGTLARDRTACRPEEAGREAACTTTEDVDTGEADAPRISPAAGRMDR